MRDASESASNEKKKDNATLADTLGIDLTQISFGLGVTGADIAQDLKEQKEHRRKHREQNP